MCKVMATVQVLEDEGSLGKEGGSVFSPPLYKQRYQAVVAIARKLHPKKVVDYGCAECKLLRLLKKEDYIEELLGVDLDQVSLRMNSELVRPLIADYLHPRLHPLHMALLQGSIAQPDARLVNFDLLTCIEVVEHLEQSVLDAVPASIFGILCPRVVVITTPNAEYNVLFPGFTGFRHHDHKFEWTRHQFRSWCEGVSKCYGYMVEYDGVGAPPPGKNVGYCSQMAIFTQSNDRSKCAISTDTELLTPYEVIAEATHPYQVNPLSADEKLRVECEYYLNVLLKSQQAHDEETCDEDLCQVALEELLVFPRVKKLCSSVQDIRRVLASSCTVGLHPTANFALLTVAQQEPEENLSEEEVDSCPCSDAGTDNKTPISIHAFVRCR